MPATIFQGAYVKMLKDKLKFKEGGIIEWDHVNGCPSYPSDIAGVNNQIGQELHVRVYNGTGSTITNGSLVYVGGVDPDGIHPSVMLAIANDYDKSRVLGMVTADILDGDHGIVTREGLVNDLDTSALDSGDVLFLSPTVAGAYQTAIINDGNFEVRIGHVVKKDATTGSILVTHDAATYTVETTQKTGWSNTYGPATMAFDNGTRTLTITPVGSEFHFYQDGIKYTKTTDSIQITDVEGIHAIYYNAGVLVDLENPTDGQISSLIQNYVTVAYIGWNATDNEAVYFGNEMHDMQFPDSVHLYAHFAFGARYLNGLALTDILSEQTGALDSHAQFGVESGTIADEDRYIPTSTIASTTGLPIFYLAGTSAAPVLRRMTNAGFSVSTTGTGRLAYNFLTGGNWTIAEVPSTDFVLCHVFCINENDTAKRVVAFMGQAQYATVALARAGATSEITSLVSTGIVPKEIKSLGTVIFQTSNAYGNSVKARIREVSAGVDYEDWRSVNNTGGSVASGGGGSTIFSDAAFQVFDDADPTKSVQLQVSPVPTATNIILSVPPATDTLAGLAAVQSFTNKTVEDSLTVKQIATPSTPPAGYNKRYPGTDGIERSRLPSGKEIAVDTKGDYEFLWDKQISDFVAYDDSGDVGYVAGLPVDGTGGSPSTITIAAAASPINNEAGKLNIDFSKSAANGQGEGMAVAFTTRGDIDKAAVRVCKIAVKSSANYVDNDCGIYLFDTVNSRIIYPADQNIKASSFVSQQQFEFQLSPDSTSYRLITQVQSTNANAYTLAMTVGVYETKTSTGGIVNWPQYDLTVTGTNWTTSRAKGVPYKTINGAWRLKFNIRGTVSGSPTLSTYTVAVAGITSVNQLQAISGAAGGGAFPPSQVYFSNSSDDIVINHSSGTISGYWFSGDVELGSQPSWAVDYSNQVLSEDAGNRLIACDITSGTLTGLAPNSSYVKLNLGTVVSDTTSSYDTTNFQYVIPESGWYDVHARTVIAQTNVLNDQYALAIYKNGALSIDGLYVTAMATSAFGLIASGAKYYQKGDILDLRLFGDGNNSVNTLSTGGTSQLMIAKRSSPQQIAASEKVQLRVIGNAGQTWDATERNYIASTKITDSHNQYNLANGEYPCHRSGWCSGSFKLQSSSSFSATAGGYSTLGVVLSGTVVASVAKETEATIAKYEDVSLPFGFQVVKGQVLTFTYQTLTNTGGTINSGATRVANCIELTIE